MNRGISSTATGMAAAQKWMDVITNNLANASTTGFKRDGLVFSDALVRQLNAQGGQGQPIGSLGSGPTATSEYTVFDVGPMNSTSNPLDMAIDDPKGMFAVQIDPKTVAYTRDGSFTLDDQRQLTTKAGYPVLDSSGSPITIPAGQLSVSSSGDISVDDKVVAKIGVFDGQFQKLGDNLYSSSDAKPLDTSAIHSGTLEGSNVNPIESMIQMVTLSRNFELAQKSITQQDDLTQRLIQSLQS